MSSSSNPVHRHPNGYRSSTPVRFENTYIQASDSYFRGFVQKGKTESAVQQSLSYCNHLAYVFSIGVFLRRTQFMPSVLYLRDNARYLSRPHYARGSTDWAEESASFLLKNMRGNCYCYAAAFCYMAKQLGYDAQAVSGGMGKKNEDHAWVMIDGRIFDPEIEYAHLYRYSTHKYYDCFDIDVANAPFIYHFPQ